MRTRTRSGRASARRRIACGILGVVAAAAVMPRAASAGDLTIDQQVQEQDQWCWVASGLTIAQFFGKGDISQNDFCAIAHGYPQGSYCPNEPGELQDDQAAFQQLGMSPGQVTGALSFEDVASEIDAQRPIQTGIYWTSGGGHSQVIYGYDASSETVAYGDPWPSSPRYSEMGYQDYIQNYEFSWAEALSGESGGGSPR
ncbi:papain-like cysteine protease family protein [Actinomadura rupiterrae]|uniref:papain-like cysteine protease family protein n=1 Tax=Actinomadura rupiterrae TaxID=559627 RepID=UPI0020A4F700|nr:papain-like cysteine protease family protein [Actinomadura rupiterrae]MCP2338943.1 hypothetical protein [Actinomadura rupiterrae]